MRHDPDIAGMIYWDLPSHDLFLLRARVDLLTGLHPQGTTGSAVFRLPGQELVQAASVGWKDEQKRIAFANPFNDLSSPNLLACMLSSAFSWNE
jgi:hypothetical protein